MTSAFITAAISLLVLADLVFTQKQEGARGLALDGEGLNRIKDIHRNWYFFAIKALLGQLAKELLRKTDSASRQQLKLCLRRIANVRDLRKTAICLLKTREHWKKALNSKNSRKRNNSAHSFIQERNRKFWMRHAKRVYFNEEQYRSRSSWKILRGRMRKRNGFLRIHRKRRMKRSPDRLTLPADLKENGGNFETVNAEHPPTLKEKPSKTPIHRVADLFVSLFGKVTTVQLPQKWSTTYRSLSKLTKILENKQQLPGARVYNRRIYDIVVESRESNQNGEIFVPPFLKDAFDIVNSFNGAKNARILSPRFAPLLPDKTTKGFLSPSLFPFYKDETEQQIMPVPKLLENAGLNEKDRERVLEMVMEVSGARDTVDKAMKVLQHMSSMGMDEKLFDVNEKIGKAFEQLRSSFTPNQNKDMESKGFTFMEPEQMQKLHRDQIQYEPAILHEMKKYKGLSRRERHEILWETVAEVAGLKRRRSKREFQPIVVLKPTVLSPYQFAPVYGFSVLGPVVLSPNIFSPLILNPSVLGPWVLSPSFPLPFIISPYVLSPYVLSPLGMAPFVFSPYVLSPNVINPYILSPVILSPIVICPDVLSPMVLGGAILSPGVLSPSILSKSFLMANVLSPTFLS